MKEIIGRQVELHCPYRGYQYGVVIEVLQYSYTIEFSSGMTANFFNDEFDLV